MGQGRQLVWGLLTPHHSGSQSLFDPWSVFGRMRGAAHPAMAPASTPKATSSRALLGISHDQTSDSCHICPTAAAAQISKRALTWQWHFGWTQRCCPMAYRHTANRFPYQRAENPAAFYRLLAQPNRSTYQFKPGRVIFSQNIVDRHSCRHCREHLHSNKASKIHPQAVGSVRASQHFDRTCWDQRHCGSNALLPWLLRQHHALSSATLLLAYYF